MQSYYRDRGGAQPDPEGEERERRCGEAVLLSLLEGWIRGRMALTAEELTDALERPVERSAEGALRQTLRERGAWSWTD